MPSVSLINEYYNTALTNVGMYGTFTYAVEGFPIKGVEDNPEAHALGLPKQSSAMTGVANAIAWRVGVSQVVNSESGREFCFVRVDFKPTNWNVGSYLGGTIAGSPQEDFTLPVLFNAGTAASPEWKREDLPFKRMARVRTETRRGGTLADFQRFADANIGKWYVLDGIRYILQNVIARADRGNNVTSDTYFLTTSSVREFAVGSFTTNSLRIPPLLGLEEYDVRVQNGGYIAIGVKTFQDLYSEGPRIPWLEY